MADVKISALTALGESVSSDDLIAVVEDPSGTPASRRATALELRAAEFVTAETGTSITLAAAEAGTVLECSNAAAVTVTVPANASVAIPTRDWFRVRSTGAGGVTIQGDGTPTINGATGTTVVLSQYDEAHVAKIDTDAWVVVLIPGGNLAAGDILSGTFADARISSSSVTQHQAALSITESQISDLSHAVDVVSNVATSRILGRTTAGSGDSEELTAAQVKSLLAIVEADIGDLDHDHPDTDHDHDALTGFVAAEHVDWSAADAGTIDHTNIDTEAVNTESGTSWTLAAADAGKTTEATNSAAKTVTVPTNASVSIGAGKWFRLRNHGTGDLTITAAAGVTLNRVAASSVTVGPLGECWLVKVDTDEWYAHGGHPLAADLIALTAGEGVSISATGTVASAHAEYAFSERLRTDEGAAAYTDFSTSFQEMMGSDFDLAAGLLEDGDELVVRAWWNYVNDSGAARQLKTALTWNDGTLRNFETVGHTTWANGALTRHCWAEWRCYVTADGASGTWDIFSVRSIGAGSALAADTLETDFATGQSIDTTAAVDLTVRFRSDGTASGQDLECFRVTVDIHRGQGRLS